VEYETYLDRSEEAGCPISATTIPTTLTTLTTLTVAPD
jgi:hypothetical protein